MDESTFFYCLSVMSADHHTQREKWENSSCERNKGTDKRDKDLEKIVFRLKKDTVVLHFRSRVAVIWSFSVSKKIRLFTVQMKTAIYFFCTWQNRLRWQNPAGWLLFSVDDRISVSLWDFSWGIATFISLKYVKPSQMFLRAAVGEDCRAFYLYGGNRPAAGPFCASALCVG